MSVAVKTPYDNGRSPMINLANILIGDMRRTAEAERLAAKFSRHERVIHLGPYRIKLDRSDDRAA